MVAPPGDQIWNYATVALPGGQIWKYATVAPPGGKIWNYAIVAILKYFQKKKKSFDTKF